MRLVHALAFACAIAAPAAAHDFVPDQWHHPTVDLQHNVKYYAPVGQEFTPARTKLDVVEFDLAEYSWTHSVDLKVRVRKDGVAGEVLGESRTFTLAPGANGPAHFDFDAPVALAPGETHFLEVVYVAGDGTAMIGSGDDTHYDGGRGMLGGDFAFANDFWFRTGLDSTVPAVPDSWGRVKHLYR